MHPLFLSEQSLCVIVFDIHDPSKIESVLQWILLMRSKVSGVIQKKTSLTFKYVCMKSHNNMH